MMSRRYTIDRELLLILIALITLALVAHTTAQPVEVEDAFAAQQRLTAEAQIGAAPAANPYWAPAHAFPRRPAPVYSDAEPVMAVSPTP